jgi:urease subunit gamma
MQLTPREFDKLLIYMMAEVALKRKTKGLKIEEVTKDARSALTKKDVMDGVADLVPMVQIEAVFTDGSRLVTVHTPIQ